MRQPCAAGIFGSAGKAPQAAAHPPHTHPQIYEQSPDKQCPAPQEKTCLAGIRHRFIGRQHTNG